MKFRDEDLIVWTRKGFKMSKADCRKFVPNIFNKSKCATCFKAKDEHSEEALENNRVILSISSYFLCKFVWWSGGSRQLNRDASQSVSRPTFFYKEKCISFCWLEHGAPLLVTEKLSHRLMIKFPSICQLTVKQQMVLCFIMQIDSSTFEVNRLQTFIVRGHGGKNITQIEYKNCAECRESGKKLGE